MAQISVYNAVFELQNAAGKQTSGPYRALVGISGGTRGDHQSKGQNDSLVTAITNNLLSILTAQGFAGSVAPGGTVVILAAPHAQSPDIWT